MPESQRLRRLVSERLSTAAEEICGLFEKAMAEYEEEIVQLKRRIEQLTVLKPHVVLLRADTQFEEVMASHQQSKESNVVRNEPCGSQQVKEEQVDACISPNMKSCPAEDLKVTLSESETIPQSDFEILPTLDSITMTLSNDGEWIESSSSGSSSGGSRCGDIVKQDIKACRFCSRKFLKYCDLVRHVDDVHVGKKAFKCSQCDKEFSSQGHMVIHSRIHTGVKPYKCSYCGKSFAQTSNLKVHLRVHTGEKPYFCKSCGKMVAHSYHLKLCNKMCSQTSGEKPYQCPVCAKGFHTVSDLNVHIPLHDARMSHTILQSFP